MNTMIDVEASKNSANHCGGFPKIPEIPRAIRESPLMRRGGFDIFSGITDEVITQNLLAEAIRQRSLMCESFVEENDSEEIRGGSPRRQFRSSPGGNFQRDFYRAAWLTEFLRGLTTKFLHPTGEFGTFSYYSRDGDFLEIHRDILTCDVAVISCLKDERTAAEEGGKLCLYPTRTNELLSQIKAAPEKDALIIKLEESQTLVMYGGIVPHAVLPVRKNQERIVSILCFSAAEAR